MLTQTIANISSLFLLLIFLTSCSFWNETARPIAKVETVKTSVEKTRLNLPHPRPADIDTVEWTLITPYNADEVFKELQDAGQDPVIFGLTDKNYKSLSYNFSQIRGFIIEQGLTLQKYKDYYEPTDNKTENKE